MPRDLPLAHRRMAEESVRSGMAAAVVMEAAAREWVALEGEESFPGYLVRREVLRKEQVEELAKVVADEAEGAAAGGPVLEEGEPARVPHPSEVIKGYRILERLGRGGMGSVYRAEQVGMNRVVALKILRRPFGEVEEHVERLRREARLVGALDHPNIVRGLDVGRHGPYHYFVMEFVEGETLRDLLKRRGVIPEAEALRIVEQVCLALEHAHSRGIVHRDVKPGNIIVTPDGTPKLTDYGLAKGPADFTLTQSGVTIGTPQYISPEQARDPVGVGIQTDLYSLGATAYHMLTGIPPHTSDTLAGLLTKVLYEKPRTVRQVHPKVSAGASFLVEKLMAKQGRHRYREPREVLRDLRALAAGKSIVPSDWAGDFEVHEARRRARWIVVAAAAVVLLAAGGTVWLQVRTREQARQDLEDACLGRFAQIENAGTPHDPTGWEIRLAALEKILTETRYKVTEAYGLVASNREEAQKQLQEWIRAQGVRREAEKLEQVLQFRGAMNAIREEIPSFGREPAAWLREEIEGIRDAGRDATLKDIGRAVEQAGKSPVVEGMAALIQEAFESTRDRCRDEYLDEGDFRPLKEIEEKIGLLQKARSSVEDSKFGPGFRQTAARLIDEKGFADLEAEIRRAVEDIAQDAVLQDILEAIPRPAAADLRGKGERELERARARNDEWLAGVFAGAKKDADAGNFDRALEDLDGAIGRSMKGLAERAAERKREIAALARESEEAVAGKVRALFARFFDDMVRRDFLVARKRVAEAAPQVPVPERPRITEAADSAMRVLVLLDLRCFDPIRTRIGKGNLGELQFLKDGRLQQRYREATHLRLEESDTGPVVVFDEPGQPKLKGELHRLALPLLLSLSGLDAPGLSNEQALVRAMLVVIAGDGEKVERRALEEAAGQLQRVGDLVGQAGPVVAALLERANGLIQARVQAEKNHEEEAENTWKSVGHAMEARNPKEALRLLDLLLSDALKGTQLVAAKKDFILATMARARSLLDDQQIESYFPGARVEVIPAEPGADARTRITFDFDAEAQIQCFVRNEDALPRIVIDPPLGRDAGPGNGRLAFLEGDGLRTLIDSPLTMECIFRPAMLMSVQFKWHPEEPLYLQVSLAGNHVGVLTDDGRRVSGRGVFAWQSPNWKDADLKFPDSYRHSYLPKVPNLLNVRFEEGQKYFQFEKGETYLVRVEWDRSRIKLIVDGREIWNARMKSDNAREKTPRIRILTNTRGWIDDLCVEGVVDNLHFKRLLDLLKKGR